LDRLGKDSAMIISIGEVLFDIFPGYRRIGGAPFNYSFHLRHFGFEVCLVSRIGNDDDGRDILKIMRENELDTDYIQKDGKHKTGTVLIGKSADGSPNFEILSDAAYDYLTFDESTDLLLQQGVDLIYFGSLVQRTPAGRAFLRQILSRKAPETKCLCDINLRPGCYERESICNCLSYADVLKLNQEELNIFRRMAAESGHDHDVVRKLMSDYGIEMVALTRGAQGSCLYVGNDRYDACIPGPRRVIDAVGAGDAYAAAVSAGYLKAWPPARIVSIAAGFASRICEIRGAVPLSSRFYDEFKRIMEAGD